MSEIEDHEATGRILRANKQEPLPEMKPEVEHDPNVFGMHNVHDFELAIARTKFKSVPGSLPHLEVTSELMKYLLRGSSEASVVYQGVRCYVQGAKSELDKQESMSAEKRADYLVHLGRSPEEIAQLKKEAMDAR